MSNATREWPLGLPSDMAEKVLIMCINDEHRKSVVEAFNIPAMYTNCLMPPLMGARFDKIIVFHPPAHWSNRERDALMRYHHEYLPTKLTRAGKIVHI